MDFRKNVANRFVRHAVLRAVEASESIYNSLQYFISPSRHRRVDIRASPSSVRDRVREVSALCLELKRRSSLHRMHRLNVGIGAERIDVCVHVCCH